MLTRVSVVFCYRLFAGFAALGYRVEAEYETEGEAYGGYWA